MKKVIALAMMIATVGVACYAQNVKRNGNTFIAEKKVRTAKDSTVLIATGYKYTTSDGKTYDVFQVKEGGSCFINKVSKKSGKTYRMYLPKEISETINREKGGRK